jgi:hypothetical protein
MLQTIYAFVFIGTIILLHMFSASKRTEHKPQTAEPEPTRRPAYTFYEESPAIREITRRIDSNIAMYRLMNNNYTSTVPQGSSRVPLTYRAPTRAASVPRTPLTPAGTLPTNRCTECSICMENSNNSLPACRIGTCGHVFHTGCLRPWLTTNHTCPNCRTAV